MKLKSKLFISFLLVISIFTTVTAAADELPKHKLTLEVSGGEVLEKDNIEYLEILLQNGENVSVTYLEKANNWKVETELNPGTYKIIIRNISPSKYLISNDYSVQISDKDVVSEISIKDFPTTEEVKEKPKNSQEIENKEPIKKESKEQQQQTTSQTLKNRSIKLAITVILCTLAAAIIIIILWFISKIIK